MFIRSARVNECTRRQNESRVVAGDIFTPPKKKTVCPSGLRGWTQVPLAQAAWVQIPQLSFFFAPSRLRLIWIWRRSSAARNASRLQKMTAVGFEPTPLRTGAWSQRLRPLGQTVGIKNNHDVASSDCVEYIVRYRDSMTSKEASSRDSNSRRIKHDSCGI